MDASVGNRLTATSSDNHQAWLWFTIVFSMICVLVAAGMRTWMKRTYYAYSDVVLLAAHLLYIAYWILTVFAVINGLGKADRLTSGSQETKASKLVFASRVVFVVTADLGKLSTILFVEEIFTKDATKLWLQVLIALTVCQALVGSLVISVNCSPSQTLEGKGNTGCPGSTGRWIYFTIAEAALEALLVIPVVTVVIKLQTSFQNMLWAISVFASRLVIWLPIWLHLALYIRFMRSGHTNIDIIPTIITEQLWAGLALICASLPTLMRVTKKFTTSGLILGPTTNSSRSRSNRTKENTPMRSIKMRNVMAADPGDGKRMFRSDYGVNTVSTDVGPHHMNGAIKEAPGEGASIGSNTESQVGILRQVGFNVSSDDK